MRGFNRAIIAGNLTKDPDLRYTVNKRACARFGVAVNNKWKNSNGELQESTEYINVVVWGPMSENCGKYLKKGSPVLVEGRIQSSSYEARDGSGKRYMTEVNADNVVFLSSREPRSSSQSGSSGYQSSAPSFGAYSAGDDDFGKSIGESGFGGTFSPGFVDDDNIGMPDGSSDSGIPF